jgi:acyl-coenzyme A synthetase/AMP-(fatty) acid ligase
VVAFVALKDGVGATVEELAAHCAGRLPAFKMPKEIHLRDALPKNPRGKLDRLALANDWKRVHEKAAAS